MAKAIELGQFYRPFLSRNKPNESAINPDDVYLASKWEQISTLGQAQVQLKVEPKRTSVYRGRLIFIGEAPVKNPPSWSRMAPRIVSRYPIVYPEILLRTNEVPSELACELNLGDISIRALSKINDQTEISYSDFKLLPPDDIFNTEIEYDRITFLSMPSNITRLKLRFLATSQII